MKATVRQVGEVAILDLNGKITIGRGDVVLREKVGELIEEGKERILLNLEKVSYMDSAGLGELAACYKRAKERNSSIKLLNPSAKVASLFQMIRLGEMIETFQTESEALSSFE